MYHLLLLWMLSVLISVGHVCEGLPLNIRPILLTRMQSSSSPSLPSGVPPNDEEPSTPKQKPSSSSSSSSSNYYSYKTFKRLSLPALAYSGFAKVASNLLQLKPNEIIMPKENENNHNASNPKHRRKVAIVTGSNTGVGYETAKTLVETYNMEVIIACRNVEKGMQACQTINESKNNIKNCTGMAVFVQVLDLSNFDSVRNFAKTMNEQYDTIDVLVNNAGRNSAGDDAKPIRINTNITNTTNVVELDVIFATNFLGHFLLTNLLLDKCKRVVNLSSVMHHFPKYSKADDECDDINSVEYWKHMATIMSSTDATSSSSNSKSKTVRKTYGPSKLAALLFSVELNRRYKNSGGLQAIAVNPGSV